MPHPSEIPICIFAAILMVFGMWVLLKLADAKPEATFGMAPKLLGMVGGIGLMILAAYILPWHNDKKEREAIRQEILHLDISDQDRLYFLGRVDPQSGFLGVPKDVPIADARKLLAEAKTFNASATERAGIRSQILSMGLGEVERVYFLNRIDAQGQDLAGCRLVAQEAKTVLQAKRP